MTTIFTKIIQRECPAYIVAEDAHHIAFLDIAPVAEGHTLVVPKQAIDYFFNLPDKTMGPLMCFAKKVAKAIKKVIVCARIGMTIQGLEVPHAHLHLIPITDQYSMDIHQPKLKIPPSKMKKIAEGISHAL
ncbi:MAG: HIT family protein [Bacteroidota bacterium]